MKGKRCTDTQWGITGQVEGKGSEDYSNHKLNISQDCDSASKEEGFIFGCFNRPATYMTQVTICTVLVMPQLKYYVPFQAQVFKTDVDKLEGVQRSRESGSDVDGTKALFANQQWEAEPLQNQLCVPQAGCKKLIFSQRLR